ncbi:hypothetical protein EHQ12_04095 [Leptospira gomenensis]|uniref:Histidine kinase N-terminal 7TM region domain-containing protein n=1 Tax=Leptospira gomenensis TaxID=2484974 RepID=A0A5F1YDI3_9LEPT|nr:histidine kinase N-terminal 7TM domain-containing protein [Leptospira gomenensis]TGK36204.1 hypothetical protein EHQ17_04625 [Leptospira gomenensis]TGK42758.1 hypothetical protein EHQ07_13875 [Leptospira gomenensis]TGK42946.1 hypothetical protein EHQ12_04095 [Leptospira gomenensis]TGK54957.1 hypothetical protein EHQ13_18350 [Leptospira gomenensis]
MHATNIFNVVIGFFLFFLGLYVRNAGSGRVAQKKFFWLCVALSLWMLCHGLRILLPDSLRELALNWTLIPILFVPHILFQVVQAIFGVGNHFLFRNISIHLHSLILIYMVGSVFLCNAVEIKDPDRFTYQPNANYHLIITYELIYISYSCYLLMRALFRFDGDLRIRAFLLAIGTVSALAFTITCVWALPMLGLFWASKSIFGFIPFSLFWATAVLHYDTFEIREKILEGMPTPLLSRYSSRIMLGLYALLDPSGYSMRIAESKLAVTAGILFEDYYLRESYRLSMQTRAEALSEKFKHRIK